MTCLKSKDDLLYELGKLEAEIRNEKSSADTEEKQKNALIDEELVDFLLEMMCLEDYQSSSIGIMIEIIAEEKTEGNSSRLIQLIRNNKDLYNQIVNFYITNDLIRRLSTRLQDGVRLLTESDNINGVELKYGNHPIISYKYTIAPEEIASYEMHLHPGNVILFKTKEMDKAERAELIRSKIAYLQILSAHGQLFQIKELAGRLLELENSSTEKEKIVEKLIKESSKYNQSSSTSEIYCAKIINEIFELVQRQINGLTEEEKRLIAISEEYSKNLLEYLGINERDTKDTLVLPQETGKAFAPQRVRVLTKKI